MQTLKQIDESIGKIEMVPQDIGSVLLTYTTMLFMLALSAVPGRTLSEAEAEV